MIDRLGRIMEMLTGSISEAELEPGLPPDPLNCKFSVTQWSSNNKLTKYIYSQPQVISKSSDLT